MGKTPGKPAFENTVRQHANNIFALAVSISGNQLDAEDIMQEVLLKLARHIKEIKRKDNISRWIINTTYREALSFLKKKNRNIKTFQERARAAGKDSEWLFVNRSKLPVEALLEDDLDEQVNRAVQDIPIKYRMPLLLHQVHGLSLAQSSGVLNVKEATFRSRLEHSYKLFRSAMAGYLKTDQTEKVKRHFDSSCSLWTGFIDDYALGKLDRKKKSSFEKHIKDCGDCTVFLDSYKKAIRLTKALECRDVSAELRKKIETFITKVKK